MAEEELGDLCRPAKKAWLVVWELPEKALDDREESTLVTAGGDSERSSGRQVLEEASDGGAHMGGGGGGEVEDAVAWRGAGGERLKVQGHGEAGGGDFFRRDVLLTEYGGAVFVGDKPVVRRRE